MAKSGHSPKPTKVDNSPQMCPNDRFSDLAISGTNFGAAAADYGAFRAGFPGSLFDRLSAYGVGSAGQRVVDLGTGTGTMARGFANKGCDVVGIDPDDRMLSQARELDSKKGLSVEYPQATAENTGLEDSSIDVVSAGQCWHWFRSRAAAREIMRILKPGGKLVIAYYDWLPLEGSLL